jgi:hypothetical protein
MQFSPTRRSRSARPAARRRSRECRTGPSRWRCRRTRSAGGHVLRGVDGARGTLGQQPDLVEADLQQPGAEAVLPRPQHRGVLQRAPARHLRHHPAGDHLRLRPVRTDRMSMLIQPLSELGATDEGQRADAGRGSRAATIPELTDQQAGRQRRGHRGRTPPAFRPEQRRNVVERYINRMPVGTAP